MVSIEGRIVVRPKSRELCTEQDKETSTQAMEGKQVTLSQCGEGNVLRGCSPKAPISKA